MGMTTAKCLVTQMMEIQSVKWCRWKNDHCSKFEETVPYALLCQVSGGVANPLTLNYVHIAVV